MKWVQRRVVVRKTGSGFDRERDFVKAKGSERERGEVEVGGGGRLVGVASLSVLRKGCGQVDERAVDDTEGAEAGQCSKNGVNIGRNGRVV